MCQTTKAQEPARDDAHKLKSIEKRSQRGETRNLFYWADFDDGIFSPLSTFPLFSLRSTIKMAHYFTKFTTGWFCELLTTFYKLDRLALLLVINGSTEPMEWLRVQSSPIINCRRATLLLFCGHQWKWKKNGDDFYTVTLYTLGVESGVRPTHHECQSE